MTDNHSEDLRKKIEEIVAFSEDEYGDDCCPICGHDHGDHDTTKQFNKMIDKLEALLKASRRETLEHLKFRLGLSSKGYWKYEELVEILKEMENE